MAEPSELLFDVQDGIALVILNRPERLNAVTPGFHELLFGRAREIADNPEIRAVVLTGEGRAFCAGADVGALGGGQYGEARADDFPIEENSGWPVGWFGMVVPKPVVCAVNGAAVGYGAELMATCDMRVAAESARIGWVFSRLGIVTDMGVGPVVLPRLVGLSQAARLLYSGILVDAREAARIGLVDEVVRDEQLRTRAIELAHELGAGAPFSVATHKRQLLQSMTDHPHDVYFQNLKDFQRSTKTEDFQEGVRAFQEKRPARWTGR